MIIVILNQLVPGMSRIAFLKISSAMFVNVCFILNQDIQFILVSFIAEPLESCMKFVSGKGLCLSCLRFSHDDSNVQFVLHPCFGYLFNPIHFYFILFFLFLIWKHVTLEYRFVLEPLFVFPFLEFCNLF